VADIMAMARQRAEQYGAKNVVVPTAQTGKTVKRAMQIMGSQYRYFAVGNPSTSYDRGWCLHKGISPELRGELEHLGITVILEGQSITQALAFGGDRRLINGKFFDVWGKKVPRNVPLDTLMQNISSEGAHNLILVLTHAMEWMGEAGRVCIECTLMAADSGVLPLNELCVVLATPVDPEVPDACMIISPAKTVDIFTWKFQIADFTQVPKGKT